jgi:hypothetical protein
MIKASLKKLRFATFGFLVLLLALSPVSSVFAQGYGHGFHGTVKINGVNADIGTVISAQVAGTEYGNWTVTTPGQYVLIVQGEIDEGATIHFYVDGQEADQIFPFHDGWTTTLHLTVTTPPATYDLTMAVAPGGSGTATDLTNASPYTAGTGVSIKAEAATGYRFVNWTAPAGTFGNATAAETTFTMPAEAVTVTANFVPVYALTMAVAPGGSGTATDLTNASPYTAGTGVNIKAVAAAGYRFANWTAPAGTFGNANAAETTFTMPTQHVTVTANFVRVYNLTMAVAPGGSGTATDLTGASPYKANTGVNIQAVAAAGYRFLNWSAPAGIFGNATAATTTFTMPAQNVTVTANFALIPPPPVYPTVTTQAATGITTSSATLNMNCTVGSYNSVDVRFAYRKSAEATWSYTNWVSKSISGTYAAPLSGLTSNTQYIFKAQLKYDSTTIEDTTFQFTTTTPSAPPSIGCFIATAAYGTPTAKQIDVLREFRDVVLLKNTVGSQFVSLYYRFSPPIADFIASNEILRTLVRELVVDPIVHVVEATGDIWRN